MQNIPESTYVLLKPVIDAMDGLIPIKSVVDNANGTYTLNVCDSKWLTQGFDLTIQDNPYSVVSFEPNTSILVKGDILPTKGSFTLYPPKFYHGTVEDTKDELNKKINRQLLTKDRLPMIWLRESVDEKIVLDGTKAISTHNSVEMYFMIDANFAQWTNDDHHKYAITPMRQMLDCFLTAVRKTRYINDVLLNVGNVNEYARWGTTVKDGSSKQIFNISMSGVRSMMTLPFIKQNKNCC